MPNQTIATGKVLDTITEQEFRLWVRSQEEINSGKKHLINIHKDGKKVGFATYYVQEGRVHFGGMRVNPEFRNHGLSNLFMEVVLQSTDREHVYIAETLRQIKPDVCYVLTTYGYMPSKFGGSFLAYLSPKITDKFKLFIPNSEDSRFFSNLSVFRTKNYEIIDELVDGSTKLLVGASYLPINLKAMDQKRTQNQDRYQFVLD